MMDNENEEKFDEFDEEFGISLQTRLNQRVATIKMNIDCLVGELQMAINSEKLSEFKPLNVEEIARLLAFIIQGCSNRAKRYPIIQWDDLTGEQRNYYRKLAYLVDKVCEVREYWHYNAGGNNAESTND